MILAQVHASAAANRISMLATDILQRFGKVNYPSKRPGKKHIQKRLLWHRVLRNPGFRKRFHESSSSAEKKFCEHAGNCEQEEKQIKNEFHGISRILHASAPAKRTSAQAEATLEGFSKVKYPDKRPGIKSSGLYLAFGGMTF